jgi:regulator of protease activity HflC (stomatin/prohibitin superfamily)
MKILKYFAAAVVFAVIGIFIATKFLLIRIELGENGVRTQQYAFLGEKGVVKEDFGPGFHRNLPLLDAWNVFDATVQTTEFTTQEERQQTTKIYSFLSSSTRRYLDRSIRGGPGQIELKSKDGYSVKLDITVKYRVKPGEVYKLYQKFNSETGYKGIVRDQVQNTIRRVFGTMLTEEFYNPDVRRVKTDESFTDLEADLNALSIELVQILIRDISFDPSYERKILDKKLADQDVELNKSRALAEEKKGQTNKIDAETGAKVQVINQELKADQLTIKADTDKTIAQINADARLTAARLAADVDLYKAELAAKGQLLEREASAEGERLKAVALNTPGGQNLVAFEVVQGISLSDITVSTIQYDFLDINSIIDRVGAEHD